MVRFIWMLIAAALSAAAAVAAFPYLPLLITRLTERLALAPFELTPSAALFLVACLGLVVFFLLTIGLAALFEAISLTRVIRRLRERLDRRRAGERLLVEDFLALTATASLGGPSLQYSRGLIPAPEPAAAGAETAAPLAMPADHNAAVPAGRIFLTRAVIDRPLFLTLLRVLPALFLGLAAAALLTGMIGQSTGQSGLPAGLFTAAVAGLAGVGSWLLIEAIRASRTARLQELCGLADGLFLPSQPTAGGQALAMASAQRDLLDKFIALAQQLGRFRDQDAAVADILQALADLKSENDKLMESLPAAGDD